MLEDDARPRNPVGLLAVNQVADDVERAPRLAAFVAEDEAVGQAAQERVERRRRPLEDGDAFGHHEGPPGGIGYFGHDSATIAT